MIYLFFQRKISNNLLVYGATAFYLFHLNFHSKYVANNIFIMESLSPVVMVVVVLIVRRSSWTSVDISVVQDVVAVIERAVRDLRALANPVPDALRSSFFEFKVLFHGSKECSECSFVVPVY